MVFVDSNVILDVITDDSRWGAWSAAQLSQALDAEPVLINAIVYAEIAFACARIEEVDALLPQHLYAYRPIPREASFLAARALADYRQRGGQRSMILPDFLIGAHALLKAKALLTRDGRRYRQAFPRLRLVLPGGPPP
jgi:predicted nucleic acid-binding protein